MSHRTTADALKEGTRAHSTSDHHPSQGKRGLKNNLYDAVAGRVAYRGYAVDLKRRVARAVPPEEALFRRKGAPARFEENDTYRADLDLDPEQQLPQSDLLKVLHTYASDYYFNRTDDAGRYDYASLDETALLALGILIEEAAAEALGKNGDLVFAEPPRRKASRRQDVEMSAERSRSNSESDQGNSLKSEPDTDVKNGSDDDSSET